MSNWNKVDREITSNTTISGIVNEPQNIIIKTGASLTITGYLNMGENKQIIVEKGAVLHIKGGNISNACGRMWDGIVIHGDINESQHPLFNSHQGYVIVSENSLIENARDVFKIHGGGCVRAYNSNFRNNRRVAEFLKYQNTFPLFNNQKVGNLSLFENCKFYTDNYLNDGSPSHMAFVTLWGVDGVRFVNNEFNFNNQDVTDINGDIIPSGQGIYAIESGFSVTSKHNWTTERNKFNNLKNAIESNSSSEIEFIKINNSTFTNNFRSILLNGSEASVVTNNIFYAGNGFEAYNGVGYSIYLRGANAFQVEANKIYKDPTQLTDEQFGIYTHGTGSEGNIIYRNEFYDEIDESLISKGDNSGLQIHCNDFANAKNGIHVFGGKGLSSIQKSYSYLGGLPAPMVTCEPGSNKFSGTNDDIWIQNLPVTQSMHYYYSGTTSSNYYPVGITTAKVTIGNCSENNYCPNKVEGEVTLPDPAILISDMSNLRAAKEDIETPEENIGLIQNYYELLFNDAVRSYMSETDTIDDSIVVSNPDLIGLETFLNNESIEEGRIHPLYIACLIKNEKYTIAQTELDNYKSQIGGTLDNIGQYLDVLLYLNSNDISHKNIDATNELKLRMLSTKDEKESIYAQTLLKLSFDDEFPEYVTPIGQKNLGARKIGDEKNLEKKTSIPFIKCYPNPFNETAVLEVLLTDNYNSGIIEIGDVNGRILESHPIKKGLNIVDLSKSELGHGIFICNLKASDELLFTKKISVY